MRFRRRTIFASLAPLIGLSALLAAASAEAGVTRAARPLIRLLQSRLFQSVVQLATPAGDYASAGASQERPAAQSLLAFAALAVTPFAHSLWMVARRPSIQLSFRYHLQAPLRC
jgi:hypothetical protein